MFDNFVEYNVEVSELNLMNAKHVASFWLLTYKLQDWGYIAAWQAGKKKSYQKRENKTIEK